jgi:hypothetical protein
MKPHLIVSLALVLSSVWLGFPTILLAADEPVLSSTAKGQPPNMTHNWEYIKYPFVAGYPGFTVGFGDKSRGLQIGIWSTQSELLKTNNVTASLFRPSGQVVKMDWLNGPVGISNAGSTEWTAVGSFPWVANDLEECWIKISVGLERYWLEIPYGFYRNPKDPLPPARPDGAPKLVEAMKQLTGHDHIIRWESVEYDLGEIQNHWRLSLAQSNSHYGRTEVVLYREDGKLWDLHTPRTTLRLLNEDGSFSVGRCLSIRLNDDTFGESGADDPFRRTDTYTFGGLGDNQRSWGKMEISVDDKIYQLVMPSSLYKRFHGHAQIN